MTLKTYIAKSVVSLTVPLDNGLWGWVEFLPLVDGTSKFMTTNTALQTALENYPKYGKLYTLESSESVASDITEPKVTYYKKKGIKSKTICDFKDVYVGVGASYSDVMTGSNHHVSVRKGSLISITANDQYLWVILPNCYSPVAQLSGMNVPMIEQSPVTVDGITYKILRSDSQFTSTFSISLI